MSYWSSLLNQYKNDNEKMLNELFDLRNMNIELQKQMQNLKLEVSNKNCQLEIKEIQIKNEKEETQTYKSQLKGLQSYLESVSVIK